MTAVDSNVLIAAHRAEHPGHAPAARAVKRLAEAQEPWGIPVFCLGEFLRVVTHPAVFSPPSTPEQACRGIEDVLGSPTCAVLMPGGRYAGLLAAAVRESGATGNLVFDAQIVALCRETGVEALLTGDRDFARFPGFRTLAVE